ncbi:STAS domain-containing protein [Streptomyces sp. NPDC059759]|uniref:STAS domain-containing protein n=1 Tax=Streptomyces sp. NPDC059759 TaxID=3346936 RepID=UPI003668ADD0
MLSKWSCLELVLLAGDLNDDSGELLELALEVAGRSGKPIVVDLSAVTFLGESGLNALLMPLHGGLTLPWLAGPLTAHVKRVLTVTGTLAHFRIFPSLMDATAAARGGWGTDSTE